MRVTKSDISLELECAVDELSPAQLAAYEKVANEHNAVKNSLKRALTNNEGKELFNGQVFQAYSFKGKVLQDLKEATLPKKPPKEASADGSTSRSGRKRPSNYVYLESSSDDEEDLPLAKRLAAVQSKKSDTKTATTSGRKSLNSTKSGKNSPLPLPKSGKSSKSPKADSIAASSTQSGFRPSEITAVGGLVIGSDKDGKESRDPAKDNKLQGKTFPSLVVLAKPWLKVKDMSTTRTKLDSKVKLVLMLTPNKFTEWLLQEGLLKAEQRCNAHRGNELKLGVYSDASKFPYTGGYVWISECCPTRFVSVFHGSIFEAAPHPPSCMLKLIYHWSCQTSIQNVVQWVKVDNVYIKGVYTWLRAVCTLAVHQKIKKMGGPDKYVEVGVISLGTTSQDGAQRQVKVEVLGIYDYTEKIIRLRAVDPVSDADRNYKKRFQTILEPLQRWVHKDSIIAIDLTVDKSTVHQMGFKNIVQASATDNTAKHTNTNVMDYLRRIVPRMFQNTLSLLSRQMIQQFLDELVWREQFGTYALQAFSQITAHIAEQTRIITNETLTQRLYQVATNPFKDWSILPANARETPANATPKRLKNLINEADYAPTKTSTKPDKKIKTETDKKRSAPAREVTPLKNSKLRSKKEPEPVPAYVSSKKQGKATATPTNAKHASKSTSKQAVDTKSAKKQPVVIKVQPKKEEDDNKGLEELYYGVRDGLDDYYENYPSNSDTPAQLHCPICKDEFSTTNTSLQKHLFSHINIQTDENQAQKKEQCQTCLLKFSSTSELEKHQLVHNVVTRGKESGKVQYNCLICHQSQSSLVQLTLHLTKNHNVLELPYNCQACGYRTSAHRDIIRHFYEDHHQHNFLQCPFCLDIYHFSHKGNMQPDHIELFLLHLNQHVVKIQQKIENKCGKCILSYIDQGALKFHKFHHHISWVKNNNHIRPLLENSQLIPYPKVRSHHREQLQYSVLEKLGEFFAFIEGSICAECNCEIINEEHYPSLLKCNKCHFKTCCERAMFSHTANCNGETESRYDKEISLENEMHCICGFSTAIGNKMAAHLGSCGQKSAYPTLESALENTVKRNMLDMLGLVRRDGEAATENPEIQDAEKTANEDMNDATTAPTTTQDSLPYNVMDTDQDPDQDQDDNNQSFTQLVNSSISNEEVAPFQTQLDFVAPQLPLGSGEIDMPLIGDLADPNSAVAPAQYLGEVHTPMFDAIADAEQQHYHQMIHEQSNGQQ